MTPPLITQLTVLYCSIAAVSGYLPALEMNPKYFGDTFGEFIELENARAKTYHKYDPVDHLSFLEEAATEPHFPTWWGHNKYLENPSTFRDGVEHVAAAKKSAREHQKYEQDHAFTKLAKALIDDDEGEKHTTSSHAVPPNTDKEMLKEAMQAAASERSDPRSADSPPPRFKQLHMDAIQHATRAAAGAVAAAGGSHAQAYEAEFGGAGEVAQRGHTHRHHFKDSSPFEGGQLPPGMKPSMGAPAPLPGQDLLDKAGVGGNDDVSSRHFGHNQFDDGGVGGDYGTPSQTEPENGMSPGDKGAPPAQHPPDSPFGGLAPLHGTPHYDFKPIPGGGGMGGGGMGSAPAGAMGMPPPPPPPPPPPVGHAAHPASFPVAHSFTPLAGKGAGTTVHPAAPKGAVDGRFLPRFAEDRAASGLVASASASAAAQAKAQAQVRMDNAMWSRSGARQRHTLQGVLPPDIAPPSQEQVHSKPNPHTAWMSAPAGGGTPGITPSAMQRAVDPAVGKGAMKESIHLHPMPEAGHRTGPLYADGAGGLRGKAPPPESKGKGVQDLFKDRGAAWGDPPLPELPPMM